MSVHDIYQIRRAQAAVSTVTGCNVTCPFLRPKNPWQQALDDLPPGTSSTMERGVDEPYCLLSGHAHPEHEKYREGGVPLWCELRTAPALVMLSGDGRKTEILRNPTDEKTGIGYMRALIRA